MENEYRDASNKNVVLLKTLKAEINQKKESLMELKALFIQTVEKVALSSVNSETGKRFSTKVCLKYYLLKIFVLKIEY